MYDEIIDAIEAHNWRIEKLGHVINAELPEKSLGVLYDGAFIQNIRQQIRDQALKEQQELESEMEQIFGPVHDTIKSVLGLDDPDRVKLPLFPAGGLVSEETLKGISDGPELIVPNTGT